MRITVEISLYPLNDDYKVPIRDFIARIKSYGELDVVSNATATQIEGEHARVFEILSKETATTFASGENVFVMKILGFPREIKKIR